MANVQASPRQSADSAVVSGSPRVLTTALGVGQLCGWGSMYYSFPLIAEAMMGDLAWSKTDVYGAATLGLVFAGFLAYPAGVAIDKGYGRVLMGGASLVTGVLFALWSQVGSLLGFYILMAAMGGLQAATLYEPAFAVMARRVGADRARAGITAITLWGGFAGTVFIPFVQFLLDHVGWRDTLLTLALINGIVCAVAHFGFIRPKDDVAHTPDTEDGSAISTDRQVVQAALRKPAFWLLMVAFTAYALAFTAFIFHMYPLLLEAGLSTTDVVWAIALIGPAQVAGRTLTGIFGTRFSMRRIGVVVTAAYPFVFIVLALKPSSVAMIIAVCVAYGACNGILTIVRGLVVPEMVSRRAYGAINGLLGFPSTLARALAPVAAAWVWAQTLSYDVVIWLIAASAMVVTASFWLAAWSSRLESAPSSH